MARQSNRAQEKFQCVGKVQQATAFDMMWGQESQVSVQLTQQPVSSEWD